MKKVIVIGAGLGGLSCAVRLAYHGFSVTVVEKQATLGGKLQQVDTGEYQFDLGPSTITMKHVFSNVFSDCNRKLEDYVSFYPIDSGTRNFFSDGHVVDFNTDIEHVQSQIAAYSPDDALQYPKFLAESSRFYNIAEQRFFNQLLYATKAKLSPKLIKDFLKIKPLTSLERWHNRFFKHPNTLAMFGRYATYIGSSPYQAPAIFSMMAHVEGRQGIYGIRGGTYAFVKGLEKLALELGVTIHTNTEVKQLLIKNGGAVGVETSNTTLFADEIVSNIDALTVKEKFIGTDSDLRKLEKKEPSLSGFVLLLGMDEQYEALRHHNVFFPTNYADEFKAIFEKKSVPQEPTIYICNSSESEETRAKHGASNLFVLINAPYLTDSFSWTTQTTSGIRNRVLKQLNQFGIDINEHKMEYEEQMTPLDIANRTEAYKGTIYGMSSNNFKQAFFRMPNKDKQIDQLYYVGGSTHPGGGTPMVTLSGTLVANEIIAKY